MLSARKVSRVGEIKLSKLYSELSNIREEKNIEIINAGAGVRWYKRNITSLTVESSESSRTRTTVVSTNDTLALRIIDTSVPNASVVIYSSYQQSFTLNYEQRHTVERK